MVKNFPELGALKWKNLGASIVSLGLGLGSGEYILWPFLTVKYGFGIMWGALLGITIQLILILELQRYTTVKGEDFVSGLLRLNRFLPFVILLFGVLGFGWPGFAASSSLLLSHVIDIPPYLLGFLPILLLILCAAILLVGRNVYSRVELLQTSLVIFAFLFIVLIFSAVFDASDTIPMIIGLSGHGDGFNFIPDGLDLGVFLGAIAYAGTGGILILSQSFYTIEERLGMTRFIPKLSLWSSHKENHIDVIPSQDDESMRNFRRLRKLQIFENTAFFWALGLLTIIGVSYIARDLLKGFDIGTHSLNFLVSEAWIMSRIWGNLIGKVFLLIGVTALLSVQLGVYDITARTAVSVFRHYLHDTGISNGKIYTTSIIVQLMIGILVFLMGFKEPLWLLVTGAVINALTMSIIVICVVALNNMVLPDAYRPSRITNILLILAAVMYTALFAVSLF